MVSRSSAGSKRSNYSVAKLEENQNKAELIARAAALQEKKLIEEAKLQLRIKEEELDIQTALKISDARTKIIEELERSELREKQLTEALSDIRSELDHRTPLFASAAKTTAHQHPHLHVPVSTIQSNLNPHAPLFTSVSRSHSTELEYTSFDSNCFNACAC